VGAIMKKIAYKVSINNPNLPNGFIVEHFETENDSEEGYFIASIESFSVLIANNATLIKKFEESKGISYLEKAPRESLSNRTPQALSPELVAEAKKIKEDKQKEIELFQQFLAWKNSQNT
jgi:hypothetical protein